MANNKKSAITKLTVKMKRKLTFTFIVIALALLALFVRIIVINQLDGDEYSRIVLSQQSYTDTDVAYKRGSILDCNGNILAVSEEIYNVVVDCYVINHGTDENKAAVKDILVGKVSNITSEEIDKALAETPDMRYFVIRRSLAYSDIKDLETRIADVEHPINGVWLQKNYKRYYPQSSLASSFLGFANSANEGLGGIEGGYNDILNGTDGRMFGYLNNDNNFETDVIDPVDGNTVVSTIDMRVQKIAEEKVAEWNKAYKDKAEKRDGSKATGVIIMNPKNAQVIAMVDYPNFDLNNPRDLTPFYTAEQLKVMTEEQQLDALNNIWNNYCITATYEPGSTAKVLTVAAGLDSGKLKGDETYICDGYEMYDGTRINCVDIAGRGVETICDAIKYSCNDALMQISRQIGNEVFVKYQNIFNMGLKTTIDLPGEASTQGLLFGEDMKPINLATSSFGQGYNVTMIQMAAAYCSIVNGGTYYKPQCVSRVLNSAGETVKTYEPVALKKTVSRTTTDTINSYLKETVETGSGGVMKTEGYSIGAKTGAAEKLPRSEQKYVISVMVTCPAEDPELLLYVVIDEPNMENQGNARPAVELARDIFREVAPVLNLYPNK